MENGKCCDCSQKKRKKFGCQLQAHFSSSYYCKIFEKLIYDNLFPYICDNKFIDDRQSGYRKFDSTIKQLLNITHEIYSAFNLDHDVCAIFLDLSKAFDRVWRQGLIVKLKRIAIEGEMLGIISSFLEVRYQRVTLDGEKSDWALVEAGVPQGSILGPLFFLIYINDLFDVVNSDIRIFADDTFIFKVITDQNSHRDLNIDLQNITLWADQWKMSFNPDISKPAHDVTFTNKRNPRLGSP